MAGLHGTGYRLADLIYADDTTLIARPEHVHSDLAGLSGLGGEGGGVGD